MFRSLQLLTSWLKKLDQDLGSIIIKLFITENVENQSSDLLLQYQEIEYNSEVEYKGGWRNW
ncbi:MAG: hypothetical protein RMY36_027850 [Nostoc sp. SerVER01]